MIEMEHIMAAVCNRIPQGLAFQPSDTSLNDYFQEAEKSDEEEIALQEIG